jgi:hypothetical protein
MKKRAKTGKEVMLTKGATGAGLEQMLLGQVDS